MPRPAAISCLLRTLAFNSDGITCILYVVDVPHFFNFVEFAMLHYDLLVRWRNEVCYDKVVQLELLSQPSDIFQKVFTFLLKLPIQICDLHLLRLVLDQNTFELRTLGCNLFLAAQMTGDQQLLSRSMALVCCSLTPVFSSI